MATKKTGTKRQRPKDRRSETDRGARTPAPRLTYVEELLAACRPTSEVVCLVAQRWDLAERQARRYVDQVLRRWTDEADAQRPYVRAQLDATFRAFYVRALDAGEFRAAVVALDRLAKLHGAYAPAQVRLEGELGASVTVDVADPDAVRARIVELTKRHGDRMGLRVVRTKAPASGAA